VEGGALVPRLVFVSDTHLQHDFKVPEGDALVHCGDLTPMGTFPQVLNALTWLAAQPHRYKVVVAGNHDFLFERLPEMGRTALVQAREHLALGTELHYLEDSSVNLLGLNFYGSPWTPRFYDWAFQLGSAMPGGGAGRDAVKHWAKLPEGTDILVTHGPPRGVLDRTPRGDLVGDEALLEAVKRVRPLIHAFGHIHCNGGQVAVVGPTGAGALLSINAAVCDEFYCPTNPPVVVTL
jgi:hypothetical protein